MGRSLTMARLSATVTTPGVAVPLTTSQIFVPWFEIYISENNSGDIYIGDSTVTSSWIPRQQSTMERFTASSEGYTEGDYFDLSKIYIDADVATDGVIVQYPKPL